MFSNKSKSRLISDEPGNVMAAPMYLANYFDIRWMKTHTVLPDGTEWLPGIDGPLFRKPLLYRL